MSFESTRGLQNQTHFEVIEIDLPVVTGTCTLGNGLGYGTPLTCEEPSNGTKTYRFTNQNAPTLEASEYFRCVMSISESATELKNGEGLAIRGTGQIKLVDFVGDPNPDAPAVDDTVINQGTFFGKLNARNIVTNKPLRILRYRLDADGNVDLTGDEQILYYLCESLTTDSKGGWLLKYKDPLTLINFDEAQFPVANGGELRADITDVQTTGILVDADTNYAVEDVILIGDEFMQITAVSGIGTGSAQISVQTRGTQINGTTEVLTFTENTEHSAEDEIFLCYKSDNQRIDAFLEAVLLSAGVDSSIIPIADWQSEINEWHPNDRISTLWYKSQDANDVLITILTGFLLDMWFDPIDNEIKLSAISVWKESTAQLLEGREIDFESVKTTADDTLRASRALIAYNKPFLSRSDDIENYNKLSIFTNAQLEQDEFYGKPKDKQFEPNQAIQRNAGNLLVQRYVSRFGLTPLKWQWITQEKYLTFQTGQIVDLTILENQDYDGSLINTRAQITSIQTQYKVEGRQYQVKALTYEPAFADNTEIVLTGDLQQVDLYNDWAGAPSEAVTITFIFDGATTAGAIAIRAGAFPVGSKIILIAANGADLQATAGNGGVGESITFTGSQWVSVAPSTAGTAGGVVYDAGGIDTDIYLSGGTPSVSYPIANGVLRAPGGGGGGSDSPTNPSANDGIGGNGGGGGTGRIGGNGGAGGTVNGFAGGQNLPGFGGGDGQPTEVLGGGGFGGDNGFATPGGNGGGWGLPGGNSSKSGGAAGSGIEHQSATVTIYGQGTAPDGDQRFINGNGDPADLGAFSAAEFDNSFNKGV